MADYLPPVVARLTGDISDFIAKIEAAKAAMSDLGGDHLVNVDVDDDGLGRAEAAQDLLRTATEATSDAMARQVATAAELAAAQETAARATGSTRDEEAVFGATLELAGQSAKILQGELLQLTSGEAGLGDVTEYAVTVMSDQARSAEAAGTALAVLDRNLSGAVTREEALAGAAGQSKAALDDQERTALTKSAAMDLVNSYLDGTISREEFLTAAAAASTAAMSAQAQAAKILRDAVRDAGAAERAEAAAYAAGQKDNLAYAALQVEMSNRQATNAGRLEQTTRSWASLVSQAEAEQEKLNQTVEQSGVRFTGFWSTVSRIYNAMSIPLFANAFEKMTTAIGGADAKLPPLIDHLINTSVAWHTVMEAVIETVAVWVPATIAMGAYMAAAVPTVRDLGTQLENMYVASKATGQSFQSLGTATQSVTDAVKPSVMELFGEALYGVQKNSGGLADTLAQLGTGLDQLGARAINAMNSTGQFMKTGSQDALGLLNAFGSLFGVFGNLMRIVPGYAAVLLQFGNDWLHIAEVITGNNWVQDILKAFMALHGAIFYGGMFGTVVALGFSKIVSAATTATEAITSFAISLGVLNAEGPVVEMLGRLMLLLDGMGGTAVIAGIGLLAGAIAAVVMYMRASHTAANDFNSDLQKMISNSKVLNLQATLQNALNQAQTKYAAAAKAAAEENQKYNSSLAQTPALVNPVTGGYSALGEQVAKANTAQDQYAAGVKQIQGELGSYHSNLQAIANALHTSVPNALQIASGAQITSNQLTKSGAANLQEMIIEAQGYQSQMAVMSVGAGQLNSALNALNVTSSDQVTNMQKVTQAFSQWMSIVTGADSQFTTFEQGITQLGEAMSSAGTKATVKLGQLSDKITVQNAALDGTSAASLAARQAFDQEIQAGGTLIGNMQMQAAAAGNSAVANKALAQAGKDVIAQLLPMAAGSKEAEAMVYALAQTAGYAGSNSLASLSKWAGNTKSAEADLNKQQAILTITTADLTQAAKNLASGLSGAVTKAMVDAIANTSSLNSSTQGLVNAFQSAHGKINANVNDMGQKYAQTLKGMGFNNSQIESALQVLATHYGMSKSAADKWASGTVADAARASAAIQGIQNRNIFVTTYFRTIGSPPTGGNLSALQKQESLIGAYGYASGTPNASRGWAWVGEAGPELVRFSGGEKVIPNHVATGYARGAGDFSAENHVHVHLDGKEIYKSVQKQAVTAQRRTGTNGLAKRTR